MDILVFDQITVSESNLMACMPCFYQSNLGIVSGNTYKLSFDSEVSEGLLNIYQGSQLIYSSEIVFVGLDRTLHEGVSVDEGITMYHQTYISASPSFSPSLSPSISPSLSPSTSKSPSTSSSISPSSSKSPSISPSKSPSVSPSKSPSISPSKSPSVSPSVSKSPSKSPSVSPSVSPSP